MMSKQSDTSPAAAAVTTAATAAVVQQQQQLQLQQQQPTKPVAVPRSSVGSSSNTSNGPAVTRSKSVANTSSNNVVSAASRAPKLVVNVSSYGERAGELKDPLSVVCLLDGGIVVSEWANKRLQVFDANGRHFRFIASGQVGVRHLISSSSHFCTGV
jgi:hypothetical protein